MQVQNQQNTMDVIMDTDRQKKQDKDRRNIYTTGQWNTSQRVRKCINLSQYKQEVTALRSSNAKVGTTIRGNKEAIPK